MKKYTSDARICPVTGGGAYVLFPYDVEKEFGTKVKIPKRAHKRCAGVRAGYEARWRARIF